MTEMMELADIYLKISDITTFYILKKPEKKTVYIN